MSVLPVNSSLNTFFLNAVREDTSTVSSFDNVLGNSVNSSKMQKDDTTNPKDDKNSKFTVKNDTLSLLEVTQSSIRFGFAKDTITEPYFSVLLNNSEGILSGEMEFRQALNELKNDMQELVTFVYEQYGKGINFALEFGSVSISVFADIASCLDILDDISNLVGKKNLSQDEQNRLAKQIEGLFSLYNYSAMAMAKSFDYVRSRVDGLDEDKILRNLLIVKGFFQNNSKENLVLADGTTVGVKSVIEGDEIKDYLSINGYSVLLHMKDSFNLDEHSKKLENEKFEVLFDMLKTQQTSFNNIYEYNQTKNTNSNKEN
ncbi:MAG TPA: hypothetical protein K8V51_00700, partial [Campylobacter avium]|nr:hypothetical protein [Campylobacter avium]